MTETNWWKLIVIIIVLSIGFNYIKDKINPEYITLSYVVPLPYGSIEAQINGAILNDLQKKYNEYKSKVPFIEQEISENSDFVMKYTITAPKKYSKISIGVSSSELLRNIRIRDGDGTILPKNDQGKYIFQDDLYKFDNSHLIITGSTGNLSGLNPYSGADIQLTIFSNNTFAFESKSQTIKICKMGVPEGCSNLLGKLNLLLVDVFGNTSKTAQS